MMVEGKQIRQLNAILTRLNLQEIKPELVWEASHGRTSSTKGLTQTELVELIHHLNSIQISLSGSPEVNQCLHRRQSDRMRKKIIHYCHLMCWYLPGTNRVDYPAIDEFCLTRGHAHKKLNEYTFSELPTLVSQFEQVYKHFLSKL